MSILNSISSLTALRTYDVHQKAMARTMERLSTGKRLNRASDDPAGMVAAGSLAGRRATLEETIKKAEFGRALLDTAEGALGEISNLLTELNSLTVAAANDGGLSPAEREANQIEADSILQTVDYLINTTTFNGKKIFVEGAGFHSGDTYISLLTISSGGLGVVAGDSPPGNPEGPEPQPTSFNLADLGSGRGLNLETGNLELAQKSVQGAQASINNLRASIGAMYKYTLGSEVNTAQIELENTINAESKIVDADLAHETAELIRTQTLAEASLAVLKIAQQNERSVLDLIRL